MKRYGVIALVLVALLAFGACGGDEAPAGAGSGSHDETMMEDVDPAATVAEIERLLDEAEATYADDPEAAAELVAEAYLENYEHIEHAVEEADHDLNEELEGLLGTDLRARMQEGAPEEEIASMISEARDLLADALAALKA
ncbi:MAG: hypothetical protein M3161_00600 [Actinomycetota bacterium]|nr:hypothetical protein [Actinomycetota bacterium]